MEWFSLERSPFIHSDKGLTLETCPTPHVHFSKSTSNPVSYRLPFLLIPMTCGLYSYAGGGGGCFSKVLAGTESLEGTFVRLEWRLSLVRWKNHPDFKIGHYEILRKQTAGCVA